MASRVMKSSPLNINKQLTCWILTESKKIGTKNQCIGIAEALNLKPIIKNIKVSFPWKYLSTRLSVLPFKRIKAELSPPWPDIIISGGRISANPALQIKQLNHGKTFLIQLLNPKININKFDVVITPHHDRLNNKNVIATTGALHQITKNKINIGTKKLQHYVKSLPHPLVAVLIGGNTKHYRLEKTEINNLTSQLKKLVTKYNAGLLITISRRTSTKNINLLKQRLKGLPVFIWDGTGENPYFGYLGLADYFIVTSDSISMISEVCFTGKPVYIFNLPFKFRITLLNKLSSKLPKLFTIPKFSYFHKIMNNKKYTQPFNGLLYNSSYKPLHEMPKVIEKIQSKLIKFF